MEIAANLSRRRMIGGLAGAAGVLAMPGLVRAQVSLHDIAGQAVRIIRPGEEDDFRFTIGYNSDAMVVPQIRALPQNAEAAQQLVRWLRDGDLPFAIRSSGHSFIGQSQHPDIVVDLRDLNQVSFDSGTGLISAQTGATMQQVHHAIGPRDLVIAGGTFYGVAMGGVSTGGGFGYFARQSGLLCDQIVGIDWIDAAGNARTASLEQDADLFWAMRGGGAGSFGLVTQFRLRALSPGQIHAIDIVEVMDAPRALSSVLFWLVWSELAPRHTTTHLTLQPYGPGKILVQIKGIAGGDRADLFRTLQDVLRSDEPVAPSRIASGFVSAIQDKILPGYGWPSVKLASKSLTFDGPLAPEALGDLINVLLRNPTAPVSVGFEVLGGAVGDVAVAGSAFPHRSAHSIVHFQGRKDGQEDGELIPSIVSELAGTLAPFATGGIYMNYPEADLPDWADAYWGTNLPRLQQIKARYDPDNFFRHAQSVPLP